MRAAKKGILESIENLSMFGNGKQEIINFRTKKLNSLYIRRDRKWRIS